MYVADKIENLYNKFQKGELTQEEFDRQKKFLLSKQQEFPLDAPVIPFWTSYKSYWKNSFRWAGRATRAEYWWPTLGNMIINFCISFISGLTHMWVFLLLSVIFGIACFFPGLSVWVRRAHDLGRSARFAFLPLIIDFFLLILLLIFAVVGQIIDYNTQDNPWETFRAVRSVIFICGGFTLIVCGFWTFIWGIMLGFIPGQPFANKYGDPK